MREYGVTSCSPDCGLLIASDLGWGSEDWPVSDIVADRVQNGMAAYCPACGTRVGLDERGSWRERMVPESALEWLAENRNLGGCPAGWRSISPLPCSGESICPYERVDRDTKCWADTAIIVVERQAALKAAKEADSDGE